MANPSRLEKLEKLLDDPRTTAGFESQDTCIEWASRVAPLLKFNQIYYKTFMINMHQLSLPLSRDKSMSLLRTMISQSRMAVEELRAELEDQEVSTQPAKSGNPGGNYVHLDRLDSLRSIESRSFDLQKLIRLLEELNASFNGGCYLSTVMLLRAVLDHVPPIFGMKSFGEVANNCPGSQSFRASMKNLENSSRKIADQHLHTQIRDRESLPNVLQVDFSPDLDVLLSEIVRLLR